MKRTKLQLAVAAENGGARYIPFLKTHVLAAHGAMESSLENLSILISGDATMARLHEEFLGIAGPTDVLTFELERSRGGKTTSGEIIICSDEGRRQALQRKIPISHELLLYAVHGMLHLGGYDDRTSAEYEKMHREEDRIMRSIGVGAVWSKPPRIL